MEKKSFRIRIKLARGETYVIIVYVSVFIAHWFAMVSVEVIVVIRRSTMTAGLNQSQESTNGD